VILCEEIQGLFVSHIPGQAAADKKKKADLLEEFFRTRSWTAVEGLRSSVLRDGLLKLRGKLAPGSVPAQAAQPQDPDVDFGDPAAKNAPDSTSLTDQPPPEEPAGEGEAQA
jgi:hypothetical protein